MTIPSKVLLDSDTLSFYFRKSPRVVSEAQTYLSQYQVFTFSIITRFEILRGLKARNANSQIRAFNLVCLQNEVVSLDDQIIVRAADIYANLHKTGLLIGDADILIAATALENNMPLVTKMKAILVESRILQVLNWNK